MPRGVPLLTVSELASSEAVQREVVPQLPDYLQVRFGNVLQLQEELEILEPGLRRLGWRAPGQQKEVYKGRIRVIKAQIAGLQKVAAAIRQGYEPYTPPEKWHGGFLHQAEVPPWSNDPTARNPITTLDLTFSTPIPLQILAKYKGAVATRLFDEFLIVSPDPDHFEGPRSLFCEPALVGYVGTEAEPIRFRRHWRQNEQGNRWISNVPRFSVQNGTSLLIAAWDLSRDREAAGL